MAVLIGVFNVLHRFSLSSSSSSRFFDVQGTKRGHLFLEISCTARVVRLLASVSQNRPLSRTVMSTALVSPQKVDALAFDHYSQATSGFQ